MAPGRLFDMRSSSGSWSRSRTKLATTVKNCLLNRSVNITPYRVTGGVDNHYILADGTKILDASGGAAVAQLGKRNQRVETAIKKILDSGMCYVPSLGFDTPVTAELADRMIATTGGLMRKAVFYCSGSEASEAAIKLAIQYHGKEKLPAEPSRTLFIAREQSYHGATLGALDLSGHKARKTLYEGILPGNMRTVPPCNPYRNQLAGQTDQEYVEWHREQLVKKIEELGKDRVAAFIVEPVVGAALGCVPAVPGYLTAMREVCDLYGVLLIFDEVMCGMGRTGYLHAWQAENVVPDIQLVGKGLAAGFQPVSGILVGHKIVKALETGPSGGAFSHGHTFQNYPTGAAAALEVLNVMHDEKLLENVREKGPLLAGKIRKRLEGHRYVADIRGPPKGLFLGIEFEEDRETKTPFSPSQSIALKIYEKGLQKPYNVHVYPGAGTRDGSSGDHIIIAPPFNITYDDVDEIVDLVGRLIEDFFDEYDLSQM